MFNNDNVIVFVYRRDILFFQHIHKISRIVSIFLFITMLVCGCSGNKEVSDPGIKPEINADEAVSFAFDDAKVKPEKATLTNKALQYEFGDPVYYISFSTEKSNDGIRYEYSIDGLTGKIIKKEKNVVSTSSVIDKKDIGHVSEESIEDIIGVEKAERCVLDDTGIAEKDVSFKSIRLITEDGMMSYIADFTSREINYEFILDATTGKILSREVQYSDEESDE